MKLQIIIPHLFIVSCTILVACGAHRSTSSFTPYDFQKELKNNTFRPKLDELVIILDASISMTTPYMGREKFQTAIMALHYLNTALSVIRVPIGFRVLGTGSCHFCEKERQLFQISPYDPSRLNISRLKTIHPGGETPLSTALDSLQNDFDLNKKHLGLLIFSDFTMHDRHMQLSMQSLIKQYDQRLSICCITVGSPKKTLELSRIVDPVSPNIQCINGAQLFSDDGLKRFVQTFFLQPVHDHDNDGIPDISDNCKNTPLHALVDSRGCPKDSDNDGVFDGLDRCQETFENVSVDMDGCWQLPVLFFKINQIYMTRTQETKLLPLVNILKKNTLCIEIQGHSDASGTKQKNIDISYKRAQGVMAFFLSMGLRHYQMKIKASGATIPLDHRYVSMQGATQRRVTFQLVACKN